MTMLGDDRRAVSQPLVLDGLRRAQRRQQWKVVAILGLLIACGVVALGLGAVHITPDRVVTTLAGYGTRGEYFIVMDLRLPRVLAAIGVGAQLAVSGVILQAVMRNPLASPATIGVTGGAGLGALLVLSFAPVALITPLMPVAAFLGAAATGTTAYLVARRKGTVHPERLALIGVALGGLMMAFIYLIVVLTLMGADVQASMRWLTGSLWARQWSDALILAPGTLMAIPVVAAVGKSLDVLGLGDDVPRSLGTRLERLKLGLLLVALGLAGSAVAVGGSITFVGLVAPHLCRRLFGPHHRLLVPAAAIVGALLVLVGDTLGRSLLPPTEIPVGLFTALVGAPYFLFQIRKGVAR